jgi:ethanolamine utilization protein EutQ
MNISEEIIREVVEKVIRETFGIKNANDFDKEKDPSGIIRIKTATVKTEPFGEQPGVSLQDIVTLEEAPRMGAGIMELDNTSFEWTLSYDEYDMVIDGILEIEINGRIVTGYPGDIIYIPKNSHIHFQTPSKARFAYFVYPADWQQSK